MAIQYQPTTAQWANATLHLERRADWRFIRIDGVRYVSLVSNASPRVHIVRADGRACDCLWYQRTGKTCSHRIAVITALLEEQAAHYLEDLASEAEIDCHLAGVRSDHDARAEAARQYARVYGGE
jgi:hypothetical protein